MAGKGAARLVLENPGPGRTAAEPGRGATILIAEPAHLCSAQWATREICRTLGFDEAGVYSAVIAVTELAHRELLEASRPGKLRLAAIRVRGRLALEAEVEREAAPACE